MSDPSTQPATATDADAVRQVALDDIEGWYAGDPDRMERSLHDDLVKRTPQGNDASTRTDLRVVSKARMVELTLAGGGAPQAVAEPRRFPLDALGMRSSGERSEAQPNE